MQILKQLDNWGRTNGGITVMVGHAEEKSGEGEEDILLFGGKSEEVADLKKYLKML